ncbi:30S ribosomal protein S7 [Candidatus Micrarchaeota archaeon]|nr:30S ribosomal protein S7 [Candidatus Micrarchaeota archaeon]
MQQKLFEKYDYEGVVVHDPGLAKYISLRPMSMPHSFARHANKQFMKAKVNLVERLVNKLMRGGTGEKLGGRIIRTHGKLQGKKTIVLKFVEKAFASVETRSKKNPIQALVDAVEHSAPREEVTRVRFGGVSYQIAVDVSPQRRLDLALRNLALATIMSAFNARVNMADALANELILASQNDANSYSVKRKNEMERVARSAR